MKKTTLNKAIKKAGSQAELARLAGCTRQFVSNIVRGYPASKNFINFVERYLNGNHN